MSLADRIAIMNEGVLQQVGTPDDFYQRPANLFVAQFIGSPVMNIARANVQANGAHAKVVIGEGAGTFDFSAALTERLAASGNSGPDVTVGVRPEAVLVSRQAAEGYIPVEAHII